MAAITWGAGMIRNCWITLFDRRGRFLDLHPPPQLPWTDGSVIGTYIWDSVAPEYRDSLRETFAHVVRQKVAVIFDGVDLHGIKWRSWMYPMRHTGTGHGVAVATIARKWPDAVAALSDLDRAICAGIANGMLSKQIAMRLGIGLSTVNHHRSRLAERLGVHITALPGWCGLHAEWLS